MPSEAQPHTHNVPGAFGGFSAIPDDPIAAATPRERAAVAGALDQQTMPLARATLPTPLVGVVILGVLALLTMLTLGTRRYIIDRRRG